MATDKEYQALIKALSGECERLHKAIESITAEIAELEIYYDNDYFSGNRDAMFKCNDVLQIIDRHLKGGE